MKTLLLSLGPIALLVAGAAQAQETGAGNTQPSPSAPAANPGSFDQKFQEARTLAISGQRDEAIAAYSALLLRSPGNTDVLLGRGQVYSWIGQWPEAEADLLAVTTASPGYAGAWMALGNMYVWSERPQLAADAFGHWIALKPDDPAARIARGRAYRAAGDRSAASAEFDTAAALGADPRQIETYKQTLTPRVDNPEATVPAGYRWSASATAGWTTFSPTRADWSDLTLSVRRHFQRGSLALEWLGARRFDSNDSAWALDGYVHLWPRAYANLRFQSGGQPSLFPGHAWRAELFQGVGHGWELSASVDRLEFASSSVDMYGIGVGKYYRNYYLRWRHLYIPGDGSHSSNDQLLARYYYAGDGDNYVEFRASFGRRDDSLSSDAARSRSASFAYVRYPSPRWGFKIGAGLSHEANGFDGRGVFGALYVRW